MTNADEQTSSNPQSNQQELSEEPAVETEEEERKKALIYVYKLLAHMRAVKASDLFISAGQPPSLKINGVVTPVTKNTLTEAACKTIALSLMNDIQCREFEETLECNFAIGAPDGTRFRVNVYVQQRTWALVIRAIAATIPTLDEMMLPDILKSVISTSRGLVLVVGATGSGKSTTLAAMINHRNETQHGHIITIEDPVEYAHKSKKSLVNHREIGVDTLDWHSALKNALRQAPDVILIGEIRDAESMEAAISFAETGHLCLATLHANSASQTIERIIGFFPADRRSQVLMDLAANLKAVVSQRLIPHQDGKSRVAAIEILLRSQAIAERIEKGEFGELKGLMKKSTGVGMQTFDDSLYALYETKKISYQEAIRNADSQNDIRLRIKTHSSVGLPKDLPTDDIT